MRHFILPVFLLVALQAACFAGKLEEASEKLEPLLRELTEEQKIDLIAALLVDDVQEKREQQAPADDQMKPYFEVVEELVQKNLVGLKKRALEEDAKKETLTVAEKHLSEYLKISPTMRKRGLTALAHIEALTTYRRQWDEHQAKRGLEDPPSNEAFLVEVRQNGGGRGGSGGGGGGSGGGNNGLVVNTSPVFDNSVIIDATRLPDEEIYMRDGYCYRVTVDCTNYVNEPYRTFDGSCNNLMPEHTSWGGIERAFKRLITPPAYADGICLPRVSNDQNFPLPSARVVSQTIQAASHIDNRDTAARESHVNSLLMMQYGQFLDHDIAHTPAQGSAMCSNCATTPESTCFPIELEVNHGLGACISFSRSSPVFQDSCDLTYFEQGNSLTSFVDASQVYGENIHEADKLRDHTPVSKLGRVHGRLAARQNPRLYRNRDTLLPKQDSTCDDNAKACPFDAGDVRVNEQPGLAATHTVWVRLHNKFERRLFRRHANWSGDRLYHETRRLIIAVWQKIVYDEYLRVFLGETAYQRYDLGPGPAYNSSINPDIANEFATAAFRVGHTEIGDHLPYMNYMRSSNSLKNTFLDDGFFNVENLYTCPVNQRMSGVDSLMMGMTEKPAEKYDSYFSETIREHLFNGGGRAAGMDLPALNIQRGRDHGLRGYGDTLEHCGLPVNAELLTPGARELLLPLYGPGNDETTLRNVDLFAAGVSENHTPDGQLGPTFTCVIGEQFREIKLGDRYFFRHPDAGFTPRQLREIERFSLAAALCDALDAEEMQEWALLKPWTGTKPLANQRGADPNLSPIYGGGTNERKPCGEIPTMNFNVF